MKDKLRNKLKNQKGSVTLFVLVTCIFMITVLLFVTIGIMNRNYNQEKDLAQIKRNYEVSENDLEKAYDESYYENEVYVVLIGDTLCFYNAKEVAEKSNPDKNYGNVKDRVFKRSWTTGPDTPWYEDRAKIKKVKFSTELEPINMACYFSDLSALTEIIGLNNLNTGKVTSMFALFYNCTSIPEIDVSTFNTSKVTTMDAMFYNCASVTNIKGLNTLDTRKVTNINSMFADCKELTSIDISNFDTSNLIDMKYTFQYSSNLQTIIFPDDIDTSKVTSMIDLFAGCEKLVNVDVSKFDTSQVIDMTSIFADCPNLKNIDVSNWKVNNVTEMKNMFKNCTSLANVNVSSWNVSNVSDMSQMFYNCRSLANVNVSSWNVSNVSNMSHMFCNCTSLTSLDLSGWKIPKVDNFSGMFRLCRALKEVNCKEFIVKPTADVGYMFTDCTAMTTLNISKIDLTNHIGVKDGIFANVPNSAKIITNSKMKTWIQTVYNPNYNANFTNFQLVD